MSPSARSAHPRRISAMWLGVDVLAMIAGIILATFLRYDLSFLAVTFDQVAAACVVAAVSFLLASFAVGSVRGHHVRGSFEEVVDLARAAILTMSVLILIRLMTDWLPGARSIPITGPLMGLIVMCAIRFIVRAWRWGGTGEHDVRVLVWGAGTMGRELTRSLNRDSSTDGRYVPVGIIDDDRRMHGVKFDGVKVLGATEHLAALAEKVNAQVLIVAAPSLTPERLRQVHDAAFKAQLETLIVPPLKEIFHSVGRRDLRRLDLADLLGRQTIELDQSAIRQSIAGKRVLVTGAGGSIGSELCRQIAKFSPAKLTLLDRDESALHAAQMSLTGRALLDDGSLALCDIRDADAVREIFEHEQPEVVFHAAALKHLTLLEQFPLEGWKTNVIGTRNVLEAAYAVGVGTFVNISTDKAAWPSSVLGYTKRLAERLTASYAQRDANVYVSVRFGNVLGSRGSVITAFTAQIEAGGPVTVTHPEVERFFMLIPEACQLVLQAAAIGTDGEVMVLAMGKPVKIVDVARQLIEMSGRRDVEMEFTGLRPGEKLSEQLFTPGEDAQPSQHPLVSHVGVPAIEPSVVAAQCFDSQEAALAWLIEQSDGHRDHDPSQDIALTARGPIVDPSATPATSLEGARD